MKSFTTENYPWSLEGLRQCIKGNKMKSKILATNGNRAIVRVANYKDSESLGAYSDWCISQHKCSWEQYVENHPKNVQAFFFDFNRSHNDNLSLVGATFVMADDMNSMNLMCCFVKENFPISKMEGKEPAYDLQTLNKLIVMPNFGFEILPNNNPLFESFRKELGTEMPVKEIKKDFREEFTEIPMERRREEIFAPSYFDWLDNDLPW